MRRRCIVCIYSASRWEARRDRAFHRSPENACRAGAVGAERAQRAAKPMASRGQWLLLLGDPSRAIPVADPAGRDWRLSHGAHLEGLALALAARGARLSSIEKP